MQERYHQPHLSWVVSTVACQVRRDYKHALRNMTQLRLVGERFLEPQQASRMDVKGELGSGSTSLRPSMKRASAFSAYLIKTKIA
jgi:hypothetical protein